MLGFGLSLSSFRSSGHYPSLSVDAAGSIVISGATPSSTADISCEQLLAPTLSLDSAGSVVVSSATPNATVILSLG